VDFKFEVLEFSATATLESGSGPEIVYITDHGLNNGDVFVNTELATRPENPFGAIQARRVENATTHTFEMSVLNIADQGEGQVCRLYKFVDKTDIVKQTSVNLNLNSDQIDDTCTLDYRTSEISPILHVGQLCKISLNGEVTMLGVVWKKKKTRVADSLLVNVTIYHIKKLLTRNIVLFGFTDSGYDLATLLYNILVLSVDGSLLFDVNFIGTNRLVENEQVYDNENLLQIIQKSTNEQDLQMYVNNDFTVDFNYSDLNLSDAPYAIDADSTAFTDYSEVAIDEDYDAYANAVSYSGASFDSTEIFGHRMHSNSYNQVLDIVGYDPKTTYVANDLTQNFKPFESDTGAVTGTVEDFIIDNINVYDLIHKDAVYFDLGPGTTETEVTHEHTFNGQRPELNPGDIVYNAYEDEYAFVDVVSINSNTVTKFSITPSISGQTGFGVMVYLDKILEPGDFVYNKTLGEYTWITSATVETATITTKPDFLTVSYNVTPVVAGQTASNVIMYNRKLNTALIKELAARSNYPPQGISFTSMTHGFKPHQKLTVNLPEMGVNTCSCFITNVSIVDRGAGEFQFTITAEKRDTVDFNPKSTVKNVFRDVF
jgi:hypothetical protein